MSTQIDRLASRVNFTSSVYAEELRAGVDQGRVDLVLAHLDEMIAAAAAPAESTGGS